MANDIVAGSPQWWVGRLYAQLIARRPTVERCHSYYDGAHNLAFASQKFLEAFGGLFGAFADNWTEVVVDASDERLKVDGFRVDALDRTADSEAWGIWQRNQLDAQSQMAHQEALISGAAYAVVWFADSNTDAPQPEVTVESACNTIVECHPKFSLRRRAALRCWCDDDGYERAELFLPDDVYMLRSANKADSVIDAGRMRWLTDTSSEFVDGAGRMRNPLGVVPVVPLMNRPRLHTARRVGWGAHSEIRSIIPLQDAVNKMIADLLIASEFAAYPQRNATGYELQEDPDTGEPIPPKFAQGAGNVWVAESTETTFGQFATAELSNFVTAVDMMIQHIASISRTPPHYLNASADRLSGEAVDVDTVIPTPDRGFVRIGDLVVGDYVFDETGTPTSVVEAFDFLHDEECWEVCFDDGTSVVTHGGHRWLTDHYVSPTNLHKGRETTVVTTDVIRQTLRATNGRSHRIAMAAAYDSPEANLPVDPYVLGLWLGDGMSATGQVVCHPDDLEHVVAQIDLAGYHPRITMDNGGNHRVTIAALPDLCRYGHERSASVRSTARVVEPTHCRECDRDMHADRARPVEVNLGLRTRLIRLGLLNNKHVPEAYFWASPKQRLALLQGLMDTDGTVKKGQGGVEFVQHDERVARDVLRLIHSLGHKAHLRSRPAKYKGRLVGTQWRIVWSSPDPAFRMERKLAHQRTDWNGGLGRANSPLFRFVTDVRPVESRPVRCIQVDSPSHLFLAGEQCVPTHNSIKAAETGLVAKVRRKMTTFGEAWEETMRLAGMVAGIDRLAKAERMETIWGDPETRTEAEHVDAVTKKSAIGVPWEQLMEDLSYSPEQIRRMDSMRAKDSFFKPEPPQPPGSGAAS